jgi:hypothetical protein
MTFSCKNHEFATDKCRKLKTDCIMGRPGCVLEGRVNLSEENMLRLKELAAERTARRSRNRKKKEPRSG